MQAYLELLQHVLENGCDREDRTGTGTKSIFGHQIRVNLQDGFPLLTTKKIHFKSIAHELLWFLKGDTNIKYLNDHGVHIWDVWSNEEGELNKIYGHQWRRFGYNRQYSCKGVDQIKKLVDGIKKQPYSRRHIISAWNPAEIEEMALPPCHVLSQFYVQDNKLSCQLYQRSADLFLGSAFNLPSYALLIMMIAQVCGLEPYEFVYTFGDAHIYRNHFSAVQTQLKRSPRTLPTMVLNPEIKNIFDFKYGDFKLENYNPHPRIKAPIAI